MVERDDAPQNPLFSPPPAFGLGGLAAVFVFSQAKFPEIGRTLAAAKWGWL